MHMLTEWWYRFSNMWNLHGVLLMVYQHGSSCCTIHLRGSCKGGRHPDLITFDVQVSLWRHQQLCHRLGTLQGNPVKDCFALHSLQSVKEPSLPGWAGEKGERGGGGGVCGGATGVQGVVISCCDQDMPGHVQHSWF